MTASEKPRRGRRPVGAETRSQIIEAARAEFAAQGYEATSLRAVARRAGVDPALVHHYFEGKPGLFVEVMTLPVDPLPFIEAVLSGPRDDIGVALARAFFTVWDNPSGRERFQAILRSAVTHDEAQRMIREFLTREIFLRVAESLDRDAPQAEVQLRGALAASQVIGLAMMRYVVNVPPIRDASAEDLIARVGPTLQRYLVPAERD